jgi:hypothetical protein
MTFFSRLKAKIPTGAVAEHGAGPKIRIPEVWSDEQGIALRGWILTIDGPPKSLEITLDGQNIPIVSWHPRPDIVAKHPQFRSGINCGFWAYLPRASTHEVQVVARDDGEIVAQTTLTTRTPVTPVAGPAGNPLFEQFCALVNQQHLSVLEIGSRVVVPGSMSKRSLFPGAASYTGFDLYEHANTDVVGDAHRLSSYFGEGFDAVFSLAVFEHLAMPWVVAVEINKVLKLGGITCHQTHFAFPLHEQPADYWRFSDQGLRSIFSPFAGYSDVECQFSDPVFLHPASRASDHLHLPSQPAFIQVALFARKVREVDCDRARWDFNEAHELTGLPAYPTPSN